MAPRLQIGKTGHGDAAKRDLAGADDAHTRRAGLSKGSGESAKGPSTQSATGGRAERLAAHRRGSGAA
jgi:hypothetical protein